MPYSPTLVDQHPIPPPLTRGNSVVSLYQSCLNLIERLAGVPDFEQYLDPELLLNIQAGSPSTMSPNDPVSQLWILFRLGAPLACIFNGLRPKQPLKINNTDTSVNNVNACKASVFHFLVACLQELQFKDDDLFTISELYQDDTNGFVKVIRTVSMVLDRMEAQGLLRARRSKRNSDPARPTDNRAKVVNEILETERSYVQDLENLQAYMRALQSDGTVVSPETIHLIFGNLNALVDFQRRFLIAIETNAALAPQDQNFGQVFLQHEEAFVVYEPFCANVKDASALVVQEVDKLQKMNHLLDAQHGINSNLIKPVQRICKYPLFMHELIKLTDLEHPHYRDLVEGQAAIKRVAENINETNRRQENQATALALQHKVAWKDGELVTDFGALLLHDTLLNPRGSPDKALEVYLFEKILVCCQSIVSRKKQTKPLMRGAKPKPTLHLNGRIYINNIKSILPVSVAGSYVLHVVWNVAAEEFELRCKTEDQLRKWHSVLEKLVIEANAERPDVVTMNSYTEPPVYPHKNQSSFFLDDDGYLDDDLEGEDDDGYDDSRGYRSHSLPFGLASQTSALGSQFPYSPPSSYPASPTFMTSDDHAPGQPLVRNASAGYSYNATPAATPPVPSIPGPLRARAQSSPNIHSPANGPSWSNAPELPTHNRRPSNSSESSSPTTPIKVNFQEDSYLIVVPVQITYSELVERVEKKIRLCGSRRNESQPLRLRYKDEDNDYIIMKDDDDISLAFESCIANGVMSLHVS
ncbi:hypothetical protein EDD21DRAFT_298530 [Dissophora ornata]|nr:hypothetical protein EDD21DRAFT_298530 [Dissophora ornata]